MSYEGNSVHKDSLNIGHEFQDYVVEQVAKQKGFSISIYQSKKYQFKKGESLQGIEIKYDARSTGDCTYKECTATNNVGIELAEKTNSSLQNFTPSGIYRRDNTWLYIVGNYHQFWAFSKKELISIHKMAKYRENTLPTIKSMLLPIKFADEICLFKLVEIK